MNDHTTTAHAPRFKIPHRNQMRMQTFSLDQLLPADHQARFVWQYIESLDLSPLYARIRAVEGGVGRDPIDPRILMALWMFATIEGISSARQLARACERDLAYLWICGEVTVNYHTLSDFRSGNDEFLNQLLTDSIATLMQQDLVTLEVVAQDGMRVRASAGKSSFRRKPTLEQCREKAAEQVGLLQEERDQNPAGDASNARQKAARARAAREKQERVEQALENLEVLKAQKEKRKKGSGNKARSSTTDPEARNMKMANGGYNPAYNVQFATDAETRMIVGVEVTNSGSDRGQMAPVQDELKENYEKAPGKYVVDGGFANKNDITQVERNGSEVIAPIHSEEAMEKRGTDPHARQPRDSDEMATFRKRMATEEAKEVYRLRPSVAEFPNAEARNRGMQQFRVRGLRKVKSVVLWFVLTYNFMRQRNLGIIG